MIAIFVPMGGCCPVGKRCDGAFTGLEECVRFCKLVTVLVDVFMVIPRDAVAALHFLWNYETIL